jgi:hypothetical protein
MNKRIYLVSYMDCHLPAIRYCSLAFLLLCSGIASASISQSDIDDLKASARITTWQGIEPDKWATDCSREAGASEKMSYANRCQRSFFRKNNLRHLGFYFCCDAFQTLSTLMLK